MPPCVCVCARAVEDFFTAGRNQNKTMILSVYKNFEYYNFFKILNIMILYVFPFEFKILFKKFYYSLFRLKLLAGLINDYLNCVQQLYFNKSVKSIKTLCIKSNL